MQYVWKDTKKNVQYNIQNEIFENYSAIKPIEPKITNNLVHRKILAN